MLKLFEDSSMEKIAVVTDTGSNLSFEQAKELGIYLLPLQSQLTKQHTKIH